LCRRRGREETQINLKLLYCYEEIRNGIKRVAEEIKKNYPKDKPLHCFCVLRGAAMFFCELIKELEEYDVRTDFVTLESYADSVETSGNVRLIQDIRTDVKGESILIIEDIIDSGHTVSYLRRFFASKGAKSCEIAVLLNKPCRKTAAEADYAVIEMKTDKFIVGFGLDYAQKYRHFKDIYEVLGE
jgi:hypoxanthine phosphoribosyltransferase